jgi:glutamyl-tRNA reductase
MPLKILGLNHNTAPVEIREQVVFSGDEIGHVDLQPHRILRDGG